MHNIIIFTPYLMIYSIKFDYNIILGLYGGNRGVRIIIKDGFPDKEIIIL